MQKSVSRISLILLCCLPSLLFAGEPYSYIRLAPQLTIHFEEASAPALEIGKRPPLSPEQQRAFDKRFLWRTISVSSLALGTATLLTGVRLFNKGKNAKKIAVGDAFINIGIAVDIAAIGPIVMARYWHRKI
jgi:hypothetical protein